MRFSTLLLAALLLCAANAWAQDGDATLPQSYNKHILGVNYSNDVTSIFADKDLLLDSERYKPQYGYSAALLYQYRPIAWFSAETGFEYNSSMWYIDEENSTPWSVWDGEGYSRAINGLLDYGVRANRLAIPLNLRWYYQKGNWSFYALTGTIFTVSHKTKNIYRELEEWNSSLNTLEQDGFVDNFGIGVSAGVGTEYRFKPNWILRMEPRFRVYDLKQPITYSRYWVNNPTDRPWAAGINIGVYYGFGK